MRVISRTVVGDIDQRFDNLSGSQVNCVSSVYGIYVFGQLSDAMLLAVALLSPVVIGCED